MRASGTKGTYREPLLRMVAARVVCLACGTVQSSDAADGVPIELWFKTDVRGHSLWIRNEAHGRFLLAWLEGKRERRRMWDAMAWLEALPEWMLESKSREVVTRALRDLIATSGPR